jgi:cell pole-organizing protein PopZ
MAKVSAAQEPSMEEILASIRRIIADDETPAAGERGRNLLTDDTNPTLPISAEDVDALFGARAEAMAEVAAASSQDDLRASATAPQNPIPSVSQPVRSFVEPQKIESAAAVSAIVPDELPSGRPLLSPLADAAVNSAFGNLAGTILAGSPRTLDDLVKDMLRPMLKAWLDSNLPPLVEKLVRDEIERVSRGR